MRRDYDFVASRIKTNSVKDEKTKRGPRSKGQTPKPIGLRALYVSSRVRGITEQALGEFLDDVR